MQLMPLAHRHSARSVAAATPEASYPRLGEPVVPRVLLPLLDDRSFALADLDLDRLISRDAAIWSEQPRAAIDRLGEFVVHQVKRGLRRPPDLILRLPMPEPMRALERFPLESRTARTLRRGIAIAPAAGPWTIGRYLQMRRFGARALVDLLVSMQARRNPVAAGTTPAWVPEAPDADRARAAAGMGRRATLDRALEVVTRRLPASESQVTAALEREGVLAPSIGLNLLAEKAGQVGRPPAFRIVGIAGTRMVVHPAQVTAAKATYTVASRAVQNWGATTVRGVVEQVRAMMETVVGIPFVERLLTAMSSFEWLDRPEGWFWFARDNRLVDDLTKVFSVVTRLSLNQLWHALRRGREGPDPPPPAVIGQISARLPGARVVGDLVSIRATRRPPRALPDAEGEMVAILRRARRPLQLDEILRLGLSRLSQTKLRRLLQTSLLVEGLPDGSFGLLGT